MPYDLKLPQNTDKETENSSVVQQKPTKRPLALYIHWPFCKSKCPYCDFNSHVRDRVDEDSYKRAMLTELDTMAARVPHRQLISIFFGGGTPSLMPPDIVEALIIRAAELFHVSDINTLEITLEANPTSVEADKFRAFRAAGVNRVSLGVQSLNPQSLKFLGREHTANEALKAVELAATIFPRYSFDMIYALPDQSVSDWEKELLQALPYTRGHMSLYQLTIEENTAFHHAYHEKKSFHLPVDEQAAKLYELTQQIMEAHGIPAYEVSNHAAAGQESLHNLAYWRGDEYIGIGAGAHGRLFNDLVGEQGSIKNWHATNTIKSPERWLESVGQHGHGIESDIALSDRERMEENIMMRFRLTDPIELGAFPLERCTALFDLLEQEALIKRTASHVCLTLRGRLIQQAIVLEILATI